MSQARADPRDVQSSGHWEEKEELELFSLITLAGQSTTAILGFPLPKLFPTSFSMGRGQVLPQLPNPSRRSPNPAAPAPL